MENLVDREHRAARVRPPELSTRAVATVILDVDSCISAINGIDWLAARRGERVAEHVAALTERVRAGAMPPGQAYAERLAAIRPHRTDMDALSRAYVEAIVPGCPDVIARLRRAGIHVLIVSHGPANATYRLAYRLGFEATDVHAVSIRFDALGAYAGFDGSSRLATVSDRRVFLDDLDVDAPMLVIGDGPAERGIESFAQLASLALR